MAVVLIQILAPGIAARLPWEVFHVFIWDSLWIMGFNLLPIEPLDGAKAWAIAPRLLNRGRKKIARARSRAEQARREKTVRDELQRLDHIEVTDEMIEAANRWATTELSSDKTSRSGPGARGQDEDR